MELNQFMEAVSKAACRLGDYCRGGIFNASNSNSIYGKSNTVQPPALTMRYIIKY